MIEDAHELCCLDVGGGCSILRPTYRLTAILSTAYPRTREVGSLLLSLFTPEFNVCLFWFSRDLRTSGTWDVGNGRCTYLGLSARTLHDEFVASGRHEDWGHPRIVSSGRPLADCLETLVGLHSLPQVSSMFLTGFSVFFFLGQVNPFDSPCLKLRGLLPSLFCFAAMVGWAPRPVDSSEDGRGLF